MLNMLGENLGGVQGFIAEGSLPSGSSVVRLDEEASPNLEKLERRRFVSSTATIRATEDEGEAEMESSRFHREEQASHVVVLGDPPANFASNPASFWARLRTGWTEIEDQLAEWFGMDQSKYQWAVDEVLERQLAGEHSASHANVEGQQMLVIQEQSMERVSKRLNFEG